MQFVHQRFGGPLRPEAEARPAHGDQMARYFRLAEAPTLVIRPPSKPQITVTRLRSDVGIPERSAAIPAERAFVVSVHLTPASEQGCEIWVDDRYSRVMKWPAGGVGIYDLESNPRTRHPGPVDWVHYHVPRATLDAFTDDLEAPSIQTLECAHGTADPVLHRLTQAIAPPLDHAQDLSDLFLDYFHLLFCAHVVKRYAPPSGPVRRHRGGLAPWQKRRATELLREHLDGSLRLATLAHHCGLSVSHFTRSFRQSFGMSPHQYLVLQRVDRAKALLSDVECPLSDLALQAGFSDQASFCRTFKAAVGTSPGRWRRRLKSGAL
jgi:AraC family transcriptional regulator